jgi:hypothetical protein
LNAREESHSDWINIFSCVEDDLFLVEVNPNPSLSTAISWKEAYRSETFWKKQLLSRLCPWEQLFREYPVDFWIITSWEMTYEGARAQFKLIDYFDKHEIYDLYTLLQVLRPYSRAGHR